MSARDFVLARAAVARNQASFIVDLIDDFIGSLGAGDEGKEDLISITEDITDETGVLSRCFEAIQHVMEQAQAEEFLAGEPDYDEIIGDADGEENEGENQDG